MGVDAAAAPTPASAGTTPGTSATTSSQDKATRSSRVTSTREHRSSTKKNERVLEKVPSKEDGPKRTHTSEPVASPAPAAATGAPAAGKEKAALPKPTATTRTNTRTTSDGLTDEQMTHIAQTKFEVQEDKLRDVVRLAMATIRDLVAKPTEADRGRRVTEVQKSLLKYEMQVRGWEYQERRKKVEISRLEAEAERYRKDADAECAKTDELNQGLEREWKRRRFYEAHERAAIEVTKVQSTADAVAAIAEVKEEIGNLKRQRAEYDALVEERTQRAQLLQQVVQDLAQDVRREKEHVSQALGAHPAAVDAVAPESTTLIS